MYILNGLYSISTKTTLGISNTGATCNIGRNIEDLHPKLTINWDIFTITIDKPGPDYQIKSIFKRLQKLWNLRWVMLTIRINYNHSTCAEMAGSFKTVLEGCTVSNIGFMTNYIGT